jgi:hypothetical protein
MNFLINLLNITFVIVPTIVAMLVYFCTIVIMLPISLLILGLVLLYDKWSKL